MSETVLVQAPFYRLLRLTRPNACDRSTLLVVAPLSGHRVPLLRDSVTGLLPDVDICVIEWADIRQVPPSEGRFGLDENIATILGVLRSLGPAVHVLALSQSVIPSLAAVALLAQENDRAQPTSLTLISGFIDRRLNPRQFDLLVTGASVPALEPAVTDRVPATFPGGGRRIYAASAQRGALMMYLARHFARRRELFWKTTFDDGDDPDHFPFIALYLDVMDLPAELYADVMAVFFHECSMARGHMTWRGEPVRPAAIARTALMTVEGEQDDVSPAGQTGIAHALCPGIPAQQRAHHVQPGVGHFGTFHGRPWRTEIAPRIRRFIAAAEAAHRAAGEPKGRGGLIVGCARTAERRTRGRRSPGRRRPQPRHWSPSIH